jgi:hypothetical protein
LLLKQLEANGLKVEQIDFTETVSHNHPVLYSRSRRAQPRARDRFGAQKLARRMLTSDEPRDYHGVVEGELVNELLGPIRFRPQSLEEHSEIGLSTGWRGPRLAVRFFTLKLR